MKKIGQGLSCSSKTEVEGKLIYIQSINDVVDLFDEAEGKICLVDAAGTTTLGPILSELTGVICTTGGAGSHLAIVSREFEIPCIMNLDIGDEDSELIDLNGKQVRISTENDDEGILYLLN